MPLGSWLAAGVTGLLLAAVGCAPGRLDVSSLNFTAVDSTSIAPRSMALSRASWYLQRDDELWLVLEHVSPAGFDGRVRDTLRIALRLDGLPAGSTRQYVLDDEAFRGLGRGGLSISRLSARRGVLALERTARADTLRGLLRIELLGQNTQLLGGWSRGTPLLLVGEFRARANADHVRTIVAQTDYGDWARSARQAVGPHRTRRPPSIKLPAAAD